MRIGIMKVDNKTLKAWMRDVHARGKLVDIPIGARLELKWGQCWISGKVLIEQDVVVLGCADYQSALGLLTGMGVRLLDPSETEQEEESE